MKSLSPDDEMYSTVPNDFYSFSMSTKVPNEVIVS